MDHITLYSRPECHLCDEAAALLAEVAPTLRVETVDIEGSVKLLVRYGKRVPVLQRPDGSELGWPFDADALEAYLNAPED